VSKTKELKKRCGAEEVNNQPSQFRKEPSHERLFLSASSRASDPMHWSTPSPDSGHSQTLNDGNFSFTNPVSILSVPLQTSLEGLKPP
jgi:hypothetical protein